MWPGAAAALERFDEFGLTINPSKITRYLLDPDHPDGWAKAKFLLGRGFDRDEPDILGLAIFRQALGAALVDSRCTRHPLGFGYRVDRRGPLQCPDGSLPIVTTGWNWQPEPHRLPPRFKGYMSFSTLLPR